MNRTITDLSYALIGHRRHFVAANLTGNDVKTAVFSRSLQTVQTGTIRSFSATPTIQTGSKQDQPVPSTSNVSPFASNQQLSKRKQFKQITPDRHLVNYLDTHQLGYCAKRKARVALARKFQSSPSSLSHHSSTFRRYREENLNLSPEEDEQKKWHENTRQRPVKAKRTRGLLDQSFLSSKLQQSPYPFNSSGYLIGTAKYPSDIPTTFSSPTREVIEIALVGRSNVGKSTLLNALLGLEATTAWNDKANVSDKPGETTQLCFYGVGGWSRVRTGMKADGDVDLGTRARANAAIDIEPGMKTRLSTPALVVTDMPGFGFAFLNEAETQRCREVTRAYLHGYVNNTEGTTSSLGPGSGPSPVPRASLKRVLFLVDSRHGLKHTDATFLQQLFVDNDRDDSSRRLSSSFTPSSFQPSSPTPSSPTFYSPKWKLQIVLTKCDLVERHDLARRMAAVHGQLRTILQPIGARADILPVLAVSSTDYRGLLHLKQELARLSMVKERGVKATGVNERMVNERRGMGRGGREIGGTEMDGMEGGRRIGYEGESGQVSGHERVQEWGLMTDVDEGVSLHEEMVRRKLRPRTSVRASSSSNHNSNNSNNNNGSSKTNTDKTKSISVDSTSKSSISSDSNNHSRPTMPPSRKRSSLLMTQHQGKKSDKNGNGRRSGEGGGGGKAVGKVRERWSEKAKDLQRGAREKAERAGVKIKGRGHQKRGENHDHEVDTWDEEVGVVRGEEEVYTIGRSTRGSIRECGHGRVTGRGRSSHRGVSSVPPIADTNDDEGGRVRKEGGGDGEEGEVWSAWESDVDDDNDVTDKVKDNIKHKENHKKVSNNGQKGKSKEVGIRTDISQSKGKSKDESVSRVGYRLNKRQRLLRRKTINSSNSSSNSSTSLDAAATVN